MLYDGVKKKRIYLFFEFVLSFTRNQGGNAANQGWNAENQGGNAGS